MQGASLCSRIVTESRGPAGDTLPVTRFPVQPAQAARHLCRYQKRGSKLHIEDGGPMAEFVGVKHAQVYLLDPPQDDVAAEDATRVAFSNFFIIDGASMDPKTGAWELWSISDIEAAQGTRIDLRILENETALPPTMSHVVQKRL